MLVLANCEGIYKLIPTDITTVNVFQILCEYICATDERFLDAFFFNIVIARLNYILNA